MKLEIAIVKILIVNIFMQQKWIHSNIINLCNQMPLDCKLINHDCIVLNSPVDNGSFFEKFQCKLVYRVLSGLSTIEMASDELLDFSPNDSKLYR